MIEAEGVTAATKRLAEEVFDLVVTDLRMPDGDGLDVLRAAKAHAPATEVILLTAYAEWKSAKEAIRQGALDYFEKGQEPDELNHRIDKALAERQLRRENENLRAQLRERYGLPGLIAQSPGHADGAGPRRARGADRRHRADPGRVRHRQGGHRQGHPPRQRAGARARSWPSTAAPCPRPCSSPSSSATCGAPSPAPTVNKRGLFEEADGGTLFLDEIGEMPPRAPGEAPARAAERRGPAARRDPGRHHRRARDRGHQRRPRGAHQPGELPRGSLLPPQRHPGGAAAAARAPRGHPRAGRALPRARGAQARPRAAPVADGRSSACCAIPWPGNVRELENAIERAAILARRDTIDAEDLPPHVSAGLQLGPSPALPRQITLAEAERVHILQTLERFGRNHSGAAEALGIGRTTLWRKLKEYEIDR